MRKPSEVSRRGSKTRRRQILKFSWGLLVLIVIGSYGQGVFGAVPDNAGPVRERLEAIVRVLAARIGPRTFQDLDNLNATAEFITQSFESSGYAVRFHSYDVQGHRVRNIIAEQQGNEEPDRILILDRKSVV